MINSKSKVEIVAGGKKLFCQLVSLKTSYLTFALDETLSGLKPGNWIDIFFQFKGTRVTCRAKLADISNTTLIAHAPDNLYRDLTRNFERIHPEEQVGVSILLEGTVLKLDFPASASYYEPEPPALNLKFDAAKISDLLKGFREKARSFASEQKIVMFRERQPEMVTEHLVAWSGKILLLPLADSKPGLRNKDTAIQDILTEDDVRSIIRSSGKDTLVLTQELSTYVDNMFQRKIWHELYMPILFRQYVIGYIYLLRSDNQMSAFSPNIIEFVRQFTRILSYSLSQNSYFQAQHVRESFEKSELVDISGSGLMFSMPLHGPALNILSDVDIQLHIRDKTMPVKARVMRRFQDSGRIYIGMKFLELGEADKEYLFNFVYGNAEGTLFSDEPIIYSD